MSGVKKIAFKKFYSWILLDSKQTVGPKKMLASTNIWSKMKVGFKNFVVSTWLESFHLTKCRKIVQEKINKPDMRKAANLVCGHLCQKCGYFYTKQRIICGCFVKKSTLSG